MEYSEWQERIIDEKAELDKKILKLRNFITKNKMKGSFSGVMCDDLEDQYNAMYAYQQVLQRRINRF